MPDQLLQGLSGLERLKKGLASRAADFVADGADPTLLQAISAHGERAKLLLGEPGKLKYISSFSCYGGEDNGAARQSQRGRHAFYHGVERSAGKLAVLVRLGMVLAATSGANDLDLTGAPMPEWLHHLLNDALWQCYGDDAAARRQENRPAWDVDLLAALAEQEELPEILPLQIVFERTALEYYYVDHVYTRLLESGALDDYMLAHAPLVDALPAALSVVGRVRLCKRIGASKPLIEGFAHLLVKLAVGDSKTVRAEASSYIDCLDAARSRALLAGLLRTGQGGERGNAAELLARTQGTEAITILEDALAAEKSKPVRQAIASALSRVQAAGDAGSVELPAPPPMPPVVETRVGDDAIDLLLANRLELIASLRKEAEEEKRYNKEQQQDFKRCQFNYKTYLKLSETDVRDALRALNGEYEGSDPNVDLPLTRDGIEQTLALGGRLEARADFGMMQVLRWTAAGCRRWSTWYNPHFQLWMRKQERDQIDLRQLQAMLTAFGAPEDQIGKVCLNETKDTSALAQNILPAHRVWPYFAERPALIDQGLGLVPASTETIWRLQPCLGATLEVLATFPVIPARWLPRVMEFALGEGKTHRAAAQQILSTLPDIGKRVCDALGSPKQELRIEAARWLANLHQSAAVPALVAALDNESSETASAAIITALERLGEDMSAWLAPGRLLAQANKGLKGKAPASLAWLDLDALPVCRWHDGTAVVPDLIRWWVILACKLKEPGGNALLERYLGLLDQGSRAALGAHLLHQFIARDTVNAPLDVGVAWAQSIAPQRYQQYQIWFKQHPESYSVQGGMTLEEVFEQVKRERMSQYLGSAINEKGILALVWGTPGHVLVSAIAQYMRDHFQRRAQVEALLEAACVSNEPAVIQFVLGTARRYRTASVQAKARALIERIADRNGWTEDELADRTIPTGGFDEQGRMALEYGSRTFTVVLDADMKAVLHNSDGKVVSALPAARVDDTPESIKEARQQFALCKKELKQVIDMQSARLYEAMCAGRTWPAAEWREYVQQHPIAGRLAQRLVWVECDGVKLFRPVEDGSLIDTNDDEVTLGKGATVRLAHGSAMSGDEASAWLFHFKDYKLSPLFAQMTRALPAPALLGGAVTIDDRLGWISDTFTLRGAFNKLAYQRGAGEDGACFYEYTKDFTGAGIRVVIEFSGSSLPEENMPAALKTLRFHNTGARRFSQADLPLDKVPPVLLAEAYGDYHAVAAACTGFDPAWEKKMPW